MDWRRAKTILIWAFLLLDSFLAFQLWTSWSVDEEFTQNVEGSGSSLQDMLKAHNITLAVDPPTETPEMYYLSVRYDHVLPGDAPMAGRQVTKLDGNELQSRFQNPISAVGMLTKGDVTKVLSQQIPFFTEYKPDFLMSRPNAIVFNQLWHSFPLFGGVLELEVVNDKIQGYRQTHYQIVKKGSGKKVISSLTALRTLLDNHVLSNGETIHGIDIGYFGHTYDADIQVIAPVWRIVHGVSRQVHYVNGITGVIEKTVSLTKKD